MKKLLFALMTAWLVSSCGKNENEYDASGTFEAEETIVSAESSGRIMELDAEEGQNLDAGITVGYIDSTQLHLKKKQLEAQIKSVLAKRPDISAQIAALQEQLQHAEREQERISNLLKADAATQKQMDDANSQAAVIRKQIRAQQSALGITSSGLNEESFPLQVQIEQINDQLQKTKIINPVKGTVLVKYAKVNEVTATGKPLYKIADLSTILLRAYVTGDMFTGLKLNQHVTVFTDDGNGAQKQHDGVIEWVSNKAEFTPKTIQTKDERANLVYAVKVRVKNDGTLKIGMYGELKLK